MSEESQAAFRLLQFEFDQLEAENKRLRHESRFFKLRCDLLQKINHECPEPFRTKLCNVLANGTVGTGVES